MAEWNVRYQQHERGALLERRLILDSRQNRQRRDHLRAHHYAGGGATDTWGHTWTVSETGDANFRVRVTANTTGENDHFLDWIPVRVYYDELG